MSINIGKSKFIIFIICLINILSLPLLALDKIDPKIAIAENITGQDSTLINLYYQGFKEYRVSDPVRSNNYLLKLAKLHDARGELTKKYYWYAEIGQIYHKLGMHHLALEYLIETSSYFLEQDDEIRLAWLYSDIGNVYYAIDQYELAEPYYHDGFKLMSKNQNNYGKAVLLNNIALCQIKKGNVEEAFDSFEKALKIREEFCSTYVVEHSKLLMAENYALIGNDEQAFKLYSEIWTQSLSDKKYESETMILKSSAGLALFDYCKQKGDFSKAEQYLEASIHLIEEVGDYHTLGLALARKADYYQEINRDQESLKILHEIFDYALEHKFFNNAHSYADRLVKLNLKLNNAKESAKYYNYYSTLTDTLLAYRATKNLVQLHTLIQNHTTEAENKLLKKEHAYSIAQNRLNEMENERLKEQNRYSIRFLILTTIFLIIIIILVILFYLRDKKNLEKIIKIANASSEGIVVHDRGNIIDSNNQFKKMFQDSGVDLTNKNLLDFSLQENKKEIQEILFATEKN